MTHSTQLRSPQDHFLPPPINKFPKAILLFFALLLQASFLQAQESALFTEVNPTTLTLDESQQKIVNYVTSLPYASSIQKIIIQK